MAGGPQGWWEGTCNQILGGTWFWPHLYSVGPYNLTHCRKIFIYVLIVPGCPLQPLTSFLK
jgi:hypothetical protein